MLVKMVKYVGFYVHHRSYYVWSSVIWRSSQSPHFFAHFGPVRLPSFAEGRLWNSSQPGVCCVLFRPLAQTAPSVVQWLNLVNTIAKVMLSSPTKADFFLVKNIKENSSVILQNSTFFVDEGRKCWILLTIKTEGRTYGSRVGGGRSARYMTPDLICCWQGTGGYRENLYTPSSAQSNYHWYHTKLANMSFE